MQSIDFHPPKIDALPASMLSENGIRVEADAGALIFKASDHVNQRIEELLERERTLSLNDSEKTELDQYGEIDDYLSFLNRLTRNLAEREREDAQLVS